MKICIPNTNLDFRGNVVFELAKELSKLGHEVTLVVPHAKGLAEDEKIDGVKIKRFRYFWPSSFETLALGYGIPENLKADRLKYFLVPFFLAGFAAKVFWEARRSDIIHANWLPSSAVGLPAKYLFGKPLIVTIHGADVRGRNKRIRGFFLRRVDAVLTGHEELLAISNAVVPEKTFLVRNALNFGELEKAPKKPQAKKILGLEGAKVVSFIGRMADMKQPLLFVKAASLVLKKRKDAKFVMLGDGPLKKPAEKLAEKLGIEKNVIFTGRVSNVGEYLAASDLFATVSHIENAFSVSLIEALLSGVPCIVTKAGTTEKFFSNKKNCFLVNKKNHEELANAILGLLKDKKRAELIGKNGKTLAKQLGFSKQRILDRTVSIYSALVEKK
jgi:glycosyltransferase involved in cell wall biosynthesis